MAGAAVIVRQELIESSHCQDGGDTAQLIHHVLHNQLFIIRLSLLLFMKHASIVVCWKQRIHSLPYFFVILSFSVFIIGFEIKTQLK